LHRLSDSSPILSEDNEEEESNYEDINCGSFSELIPGVSEEMFEPLYFDSPTTVCGAYFSIMHFVNQNKLT